MGEAHAVCQAGGAGVVGVVAMVVLVVVVMRTEAAAEGVASAVDPAATETMAATATPNPRAAIHH